MVGLGRHLMCFHPTETTSPPDGNGAAYCGDSTKRMFGVIADFGRVGLISGEPSPRLAAGSQRKTGSVGCITPG